MFGQKNARIKELVHQRNDYETMYRGNNSQIRNYLQPEIGSLKREISDLKGTLNELATPFKTYTVILKGDTPETVQAQFEFEHDGWYLFQRATPTGREVVSRFRSNRVVSVHVD